MMDEQSAGLRPDPPDPPGTSLNYSQIFKSVSTVQNIDAIALKFLSFWEKLSAVYMLIFPVATFSIIWPVMQTTWISSQSYEEIMVAQDSSSAAPAYQCGLWRNHPNSACTWLAPNMTACRAFLDVLIPLRKKQDWYLDAGFGIAGPIVTLFFGLPLIYWGFSCSKNDSNRSPQDSMENQLAGRNVGAADGAIAAADESRQAQKSCHLVERIFGFIWEPIPDIPATQKLRNRANTVAFASCGALGVGFALASELWIQMYTPLETFVLGTGYPQMTGDPTSTACLDRDIPFKADFSITYSISCWVVLCALFLTTMPIRAFQRVRSRLRNDGAGSSSTFIGSWVSIILAGFSLYFFGRLFFVFPFKYIATIRILEDFKPAVLLVCVILLILQQLEAFSLEYLAHLEMQGELMTSPIKNDVYLDIQQVLKTSPVQIGMDSCSEPQIDPQTSTWFRKKRTLLRKRLAMLLLCIPDKLEADDVYQAVIQPLGARLDIGVTSFRYDRDTTPCTIRLLAGGVVYTVGVKKSVQDAIRYALTKKKYVWCDAVSVTFLRWLDPNEGKAVFENMAMVYKFYTCVPSLNWVVDPTYCKRGWMWQEYICGAMLVCDPVDEGTLAQVLEERREQVTRHRTVLPRRKMTTKLIGDLLQSAVKHYGRCEITKEEDLPNACFGLLKSYGLFMDLPTSEAPLERFANSKVTATFESTLHPLRILMRVLIRVLRERRGIECAVQFINSKQGKSMLACTLTREEKKKEYTKECVMIVEGTGPEYAE